MLISVTEARKSPGQAFGFSLEETAGPFELGAEEVVLVKPVSISGSIVADAEGISVRGALKTAIKAECARCLKPLTEPLDAEFNVRFHKSAGDDDEIYLYEGDSLDITDMVKDYALLAVPIRSLCRPDCKGLCAVCGADLNAGGCAHGQ